MIHPNWWGNYAIAEKELRYWRIGPSTLWIQRLVHEWRVYHSQRPDAIDSSLVVYALTSLGDIEPFAVLNRFVFSRVGEKISLLPSLADRAVVVRPEDPLSIMSGEEATLYVSTPLWIRITAENSNKVLLEVPSYRPSDTWFGTSTLEGELCYASRTSGRLELADLPFRPHRATTPIRLQNRTKETLRLERIKVPVKYLALFQGEDTFLWTQTATLICEGGGDMAALQLGRRPPKEAGQVIKIGEARERAEKNLMVRVFSKLFGNL